MIGEKFVKKVKKLINDENRATIQKFLLPAVVITFFVGIILSYYNMLYSQTRDSIIKNGQSAAMQSKDYINDYLSTSIDAIKLTAYTIDGMLKNHKTNKEILDYLMVQTTAITSTVFENTSGLYGYVNGEFLDGIGWVPGPDFVPTERPWYTKAVANNGNITLIDPYLDAQTGEILMAVAKRLSDGKSVVAMDITLDEIQNITEDAVKSGKSDYEFILDTTNMVVAHSDKDELGKHYESNQDNFWNTILDNAKSNSDFFEFDFEDKRYVVYWENIENGWRCFSIKDATEVFTPLKIILGVTILVVVLIIIVLSYILNKSNQRYNVAQELNDQLSSISNIYLSVYNIDVIEDTFKEIKASNSVDKNHISAKSMLEETIRANIHKISLEDTLKFIDFNTLNERLKDSETIAIEYQNKDKKWRRMRFIVSQRLKNGIVSNVLWLVESIDKEKKERDTLLDLSERAFAASEAKSSFLSQMSHEIRTPINAVLGMNEMILRECNDSEIIAYAESVKSAGNTLLNLINDILDFSKIEAGKIEIIPVEYDLSSVINDLVNMIQIKADNKGLALALDFDKNLPKMLYGDEIRVKQIITNILTNSVKYTEKGSVTFSMGFKRDENDPESVILLVSIKDTGIGIKKEDMKKLFAEFERIDEERNRNVEGTGLGMTITKNLLYLMESTLEVESIYGLGSKFSFELKQKVIKWEPLGDYETSFKESLKERNKYKEKFTAPTAKVLVIDDNPMNLMVFKNLLKQTKMKIYTANSGDEGLLLTQDTKYDIIFLDHMMPDKDGIETLQELRAQKNNINCNTITVCLTANAISGAREKYLKAGFDNYLTKPINPDKLEETLLEYLPKEKIEAATEEISNEQPKSKNQDISAIQANYKYLNIATGLNYSNGSEEMLKLSIEIFCDLKDKSKEKIQKAFDEKNWNNYTTFVHALKSTSLSIGGEETSKLAKKLEAEGDILRNSNSSETDKQKAEKFIKSHHSEVLELYDKLVEEGRRYLNEGKNDEIQNSLDVQAENSSNDDDDSDLELMLGFQEAFENEDWTKYAELLQEINNDIDEEVSNIIKQLDIECKKIISDTISDDERDAAINFIKKNHSKVLEML